MSLDAHAIAQDIEHRTAHHHAVHAAAGHPPVNVPQTFCEIWPTAKPVLELIAGGIIFIPSVGAVAGAALQGLMKVGDDIAAQVCHKP